MVQRSSLPCPSVHSASNPRFRIEPERDGRREMLEMKICFLLATASSITTAALADTLTFTHEFSPDGAIQGEFDATSSSGFALTQFDESFWTTSFARFDPTAGGGRTLTGVDIEVFAEYSGRGELTGSGALSYSFGGGFFHDGVDMGFSAGSGDGNGGGIVGEEITISAGVSYSYQVDSDRWSALTGTGSWTWSWFHTANELVWSNMDPNSLGLRLEEGASVTVTYTYEASSIPVPGAGGIAGLVALGLAGGRRRR